MSAYEDELPKNFGIKLIYFLHPSIGGILALENHNLNYTYPYNIKYFEDLPGFYPSNLTTNSLKGNNINMTYLNLGGVYKFNNQWLEIEAELKAGILNPNVIKPKRQVFTKRDSYERMGVDIDIQRVFPVSIHNQISLTYYPFKKIRLGINGRFQISGSKFSLPYTRTIYHWTEENFTKQKIEMQKSKFWISTNDFGITYRFN
jgi:hypothetical protein